VKEEPAMINIYSKIAWKGYDALQTSDDTELQSKTRLVLSPSLTVPLSAFKTSAFCPQTREFYWFQMNFCFTASRDFQCVIEMTFKFGRILLFSRVAFTVVNERQYWGVNLLWSMSVNIGELIYCGQWASTLGS
jgi:hypothetical protein